MEELKNKTELREMTTEEVSIFMLLYKATEDKAIELFNELCKTDGGWVLKAIEKRFEVLSLKCDKKTMIMVLSMGDGIVGKCAKYVDDIYVKCKSKGLKQIDFTTFTNKIYPMGFPVF